MALRRCLVLVLVCLAATAQAAEITVRLDDPPSEGTLVFLLFDSANAFGDLRDPILTLSFPAHGRDTFQVRDIPPGEYALVVYYDENGNGRLDENFIGIPIEPLGFSNSYRPKGPPSYSRARFRLEEGEIRTFAVGLYRPLGKRGRLGLGVGVIGRSSPYRDSDTAVLQAIPAVTYIGERLQLFGPNLQIGLAGSGDLRLALTARYRIAVYEEDDSPALQGLGDRKSTLMAGLAVEYDLFGGLELSASYEHDVLDHIGGAAARLGLERSFQWGVISFSPELGLNWSSSRISNHDFGVPESKAAAGRPAYRLDDTFSLEVGVGTFIELSRDWRIVLNSSVEFFNSEVADSPIVSKKQVVKGFAALNYVF